MLCVREPFLSVMILGERKAEWNKRLNERKAQFSKRPNGSNGRNVLSKANRINIEKIMLNVYKKCYYELTFINLLLCTKSTNQ